MKNLDFSKFTFKNLQNWHFPIFRFFSKLSFFQKVWFFEIFYFLKIFFLHDEIILFCSDFFSVIKYVSVLTPETIQNTCRGLTMTLNPRSEPNIWRKLVKSPRFSFNNYRYDIVYPQELSLVFVKISGASLQMDLARSSGGVGWPFDD